MNNEQIASHLDDANRKAVELYRVMTTLSEQGSLDDQPLAALFTKLNEVMIILSFASAELRKTCVKLPDANNPQEVKEHVISTLTTAMNQMGEVMRRQQEASSKKSPDIAYGIDIESIWFINRFLTPQQSSVGCGPVEPGWGGLAVYDFNPLLDLDWDLDKLADGFYTRTRGNGLRDATLLYLKCKNKDGVIQPIVVDIDPDDGKYGEEYCVAMRGPDESRAYEWISSHRLPKNAVLNVRALLANRLQEIIQADQSPE